MSPWRNIDFTRLFSQLVPNRPNRFNRLRRFSQLTQPPCPGGSTLIAAPRSGRGGRRFKSCHSDQHLAENSTRRATDYATASWDEERIPRNRNRPISAHTLRGPFRLSHGPVCRIFTRAAVRPRTGARCFFHLVGARAASAARREGFAEW